MQHPTTSRPGDATHPLRIGFSGHRDLAQGRGPSESHVRERALAEAVQELVHVLLDADTGLVRGGLRWMSGLADGADMRAAETVLGCSHADQRVEFQPISPFPLGVFLGELPEQEVKRAEHLWGRSTEPVEFDFEPGAEQEPGPAREAALRAGYVRLGEWLVERADLMVVVLDAGREDGGAGGTGWVWNRAVRTGLPGLRLRWREGTSGNYDWVTENAEGCVAGEQGALRRLVAARL